MGDSDLRMFKDSFSIGSRAWRNRVTTRTLATMAAALEVTAGCTLIANPSFVDPLLIGGGLSSDGSAVGRVGGFGLLSLGLACWPSTNVVSAQAIFGLFTYNLLSALYVSYLSVVGGFEGYLLWPACALHGFLALLLGRPAYEAARRECHGLHFPKITVQIASEIVSTPNQKAELSAKKTQAHSH